MSVPTGSRTPQLQMVILCGPRLCLPASPPVPRQRLPGGERKASTRPRVPSSQMEQQAAWSPLLNPLLKLWGLARCQDQ